MLAFFGLFFVPTSHRATSSGLGTGADPSHMHGSWDKGIIAGAAQLGRKSNPGNLLKWARRSGQTEAQAYLLAQESKHKLSAAQSALQMMQVRVQHSKGMMQIERRYQQLQAQHGKAALRYDLGRQETRAELNGYEREFSSASNILAGID